MPDANPPLFDGPADGHAGHPAPGLGDALRALPQVDPPAGGWARLRADLASERPARRLPHPAWWALAASFLLAAALPHWRGESPGTTPGTRGADTVAQPAVDAEAERLLALQRESALLDLLVTQRLNSGIQRADFAAVSSQVIERVQWIDTVLSDPATTSPTAQYALWSQRVLLLRQLVYGDAGVERNNMPNPTYTL
ncbi:MAG: hypothetical protein KDJ14_03090 [Xanthomonadales bacterium]|nr:hypothetical protein [Xanthomonadales bacterium]